MLEFWCWMNLSTRIPSKMLCNCVCLSVIYGGSNLRDVGQFHSEDVEVLFSVGSGDYITMAIIFFSENIITRIIVPHFVLIHISSTMV